MENADRRLVGQRGEAARAILMDRGDESMSSRLESTPCSGYYSSVSIENMDIDQFGVHSGKCESRWTFGWLLS